MPPLYEWSANTITIAIRQKEVSAVEIIEAALARFQAVNPVIKRLLHNSVQDGLLSNDHR